VGQERGVEERSGVKGVGEASALSCWLSALVLLVLLFTSCSLSCPKLET
jgi:Na+-driven multidrug efflux pump